MKKILKTILFVVLCQIFILSVKSVNVSPNFVKCKKTAFETLKLVKSNFMNLAITIEEDTIIAIPYTKASPFISKLSIEKGVFEGIDYGQWGGGVRFLPYNAEAFATKPRYCPFCRSTGENCCRLSKLPVQKNVFQGIFENVDCLKHKGIARFIFSPRNDISMFGVIDENCCGFFAVGTKNFAITSSLNKAKYCGKIYELVFTQNNYEAVKIVEIRDRPEAFLVVGNIAYITTKTSLLAFEDNQLCKLIDIDRDLCPGTMVYSDDCLFIGMRAGFICKYDLRSSRSEWYRYVGPSFE
jgi:hypothetical protein